MMLETAGGSVCVRVRVRGGGEARRPCVRGSGSARARPGTAAAVRVCADGSSVPLFAPRVGNSWVSRVGAELAGVGAFACARGADAAWKGSGWEPEG